MEHKIDSIYTGTFKHHEQETVIGSFKYVYINITRSKINTPQNKKSKAVIKCSILDC